MSIAGSRGLLRAAKKLQAPRKPYLPGLDPKNIIPPSRWNIVRGDLVVMLSGIEEGKQGVVQEVIRKQNKVIVEGFNVKQVKLTEKDGYTERTVTRAEPVHVTNVSLVCPETNRPTSVMKRYLEDGTRARIAKISGAIIPRPEILKQRRRPKNLIQGPKDTPAEAAHKITFKGLDTDGNEIK